MKFDPDGRFAEWLTLGGIWIMGLVLVGFLAVVLYVSYREGKELERLPPAERAVVKHVMPDGTICYQPRAGWSRPLSCVRGEGK